MLLHPPVVDRVFDEELRDRLVLERFAASPALDLAVWVFVFLVEQDHRRHILLRLAPNVCEVVLKPCVFVSGAKPLVLILKPLFDPCDHLHRPSGLSVEVLLRILQQVEDLVLHAVDPTAVNQVLVLDKLLRQPDQIEVKWILLRPFLGFLDLVHELFPIVLKLRRPVASRALCLG